MSGETVSTGGSKDGRPPMAKVSSEEKVDPALLMAEREQQTFDID